MNKMLFKLKKIESSLSFFCKAKDKTYIHLFCRCRRTSILWRQLLEFLGTGLDLSITSPQSAIFVFLQDDLEHKLLLNHILLIFKNYLYQARENILNYVNYLLYISLNYINYIYIYRQTVRSKKIFDNWKPFKIDEKCFSFHLESSFRSQDIQIFVLTFWSRRKTA